MSLLTRLGLQRSERERAAIDSLRLAERLMRAGARIDEIRSAAEPAFTVDVCGDPVASAWRSLFQGNIEDAQRSAYAAADDRPYDVDSRVVHGTVRLARNELDHAEHEFEQVIEEFGAEADAADGRRAVILARGHATHDDLPASDDEWQAAARLLTTLWRLAGVAESRMAALTGGHPDCLALLRGALEDGDGTL